MFTSTKKYLLFQDMSRFKNSLNKPILFHGSKEEILQIVHAFVTRPVKQRWNSAINAVHSVNQTVF